MFTGVRLKEKVRPVAASFRGIAHKNRLAIIYLLSFGPMEAGEIVSDIDLPQNLVEHHLGAMLKTGWVTKARVGRTVTYQLNEKAFEEMPKLIKNTPFYNRLLIKFKKF